MNTVDRSRSSDIKRSFTLDGDFVNPAINSPRTDSPKEPLSLYIDFIRQQTEKHTVVGNRDGAIEDVL
jgi:hypothetical protein